MMHDRWTDRLSEYLDNELAAAERAELEAHLATCPDCRGVLEELRQVVRTAAAVQDEPPARDLWAGIEARLGPVAAGADARVISLVERRRHFTFTVPQLAAASVALMAGSAGIVWLLVMRGPAGTPVTRSVAVGAVPATSAPAGGQGAKAPAVPAQVERSAQPAAGPGSGSEGPSLAASSRSEPPERAATPRVRLARSARPLTPEARATRDYNQAVADLQSLLRKERSRLKPETVKALEASLADIDKAIADARRAVARDPANVYLNSHLAESMRLKLELLQQVATITQS